jgi:hypothetical protein
VRVKGSLHRWRQRRRVQQGLGKALLIVDRQADDLRFLDRPVSVFQVIV